MSSIVTCNVSSYPSTTIATESPTRIMSTPAASTARADGASYAVTITNGIPEPLRATTSGAPRARAARPVSAIICPPPSRARTAPGGRWRVAAEQLPRLSGRRRLDRCRRAAVSAAVQLASREEVPTAVRTHLDDVAGELVVRRAQSLELALVDDAATVGLSEV